MTELLSRSAAFVIGVSLVLLFLQSVLRVSVVNRPKGDRLALIVGHVAHTTVAHVASRRRTYDRIQDALAWVLPLYVLLLIAVWFVLVQMGFSLMIWSLQAEPSLLRAFIASGSALSTLGFLTPPDLSGQLLAIPEGAFGLGIVVFFFTFIPGYQTTVQTRELKVAWLYARAGPAPTALSLMEWLHRSGGTYEATPVWEDWEAWFRLLIETHTRAPVVAVIPSVHRGQSWLVVAAAVLDTASLWLSSLDAKDHASATLCYSTGVNALKSIAVQLGRRPNRPAAGLPAEPLNRVGYEALCRRLESAGAPVKADTHSAWRCFTALRRDYEHLLPQLATSLLVPMDNSVLLPVAD